MEKKVSLPSAYSYIAPMSFYPDKVTVNYQIEHSFSRDQLDRCLYHNGITKRGDNAWTGHIYLRVAASRPRLPYALRVSRARYSAPLNFYLDLNVLREVHALASNPNGEATTEADAINFLPRHLVQADNRWAWSLMDNLIDQGFNATSEVVEDIQRERPHAQAPSCSHISVSSIEATVDIYAPNPRHLVRAYSPAFGALLRENQHREYQPLRIVSPEANWMVHGFIADGDRIKMYAKTNRRVRWEYRFAQGAFRRLGIARALNDERTFAAIFERCAQQAASTLSALRARTRRVFNLHQRHTPIDLISAFAGSVRDASVLHELLDCLIYTQKVDHSLFSRGLVRRLRERGVLQPSLAHGYSCVSAEYVRALDKLARAQRGYFSYSLLRPLPRVLH